MITSNKVTPSILLIFPKEWLPQRRKEWEPLSIAAAEAGFNAIVTDWDSLLPGEEDVKASQCMVMFRCKDCFESKQNFFFNPNIVMTTWGVVEYRHRELFNKIIDKSNSYFSEVDLIGYLDSKCELEKCFRNYELKSGCKVSRPPTFLYDEIHKNDAISKEEMVIVKPDRSGQCKGIEIVSPSTVFKFAQDVENGIRKPFVVQHLVDNKFLYEGRRWDIRIHLLITSLLPLRYHIYHEGIAKTTGAVARPGSMCLEEWLNAESFLEGIQKAENISIHEMLSYIGMKYTPMHDFWEKVDDILHHLSAGIALYAEEGHLLLDKGFLFPGIDLIVGTLGDREYEVKLLEINSHPGLGWKPYSLALPTYRSWFKDLIKLI